MFITQTLKFKNAVRTLEFCCIQMSVAVLTHDINIELLRSEKAENDWRKKIDKVFVVGIKTKNGLEVNFCPFCGSAVTTGLLPE